MSENKTNNKTFYKKQRDTIYYVVNEYYVGTKSRIEVLTDFLVCCIKTGELKKYETSDCNSGLLGGNVV